VFDALCDADDLDGAYRLLLETGFPSPLYQVTMGATTVWERWDAILPDGRVTPMRGIVNAGSTLYMNSLNHSVFGSLCDWLHRTVAGLAPAEPGYRRIRFAPQPGRHLTHASARHITPYGSASISWRREADAFEVELEVPPNTTGEVFLPDGSDLVVQSGVHRFQGSVR